MSIYSHTIKDFQFDKLYRAVQTALKVDDETFASPLAAIKKHNEPAVKKVLADFKGKPTHKMEAFFEGSSIFVHVIDDHTNKVVDKSKTMLIKDHQTLLKASRELLAEKKEQQAKAQQVVATHKIKPIYVLHKDFSDEVMTHGGKLGKFIIKDLNIDILLSDPVVLQHIPNGVSDAVLAQKLHNAADQDMILGELVSAYVKASSMIGPRITVAQAETEFKREIPGVIARATKRASKPITDLLKMNIDEKRFKTEMKISLGVAITGTAVGVAATVGSIVTAPLHLGVATAASVAATAQSLKATVDLIIDARRTLEATTKELDKALQTVVSQYKDAKPAQIGAGEVGKTFVNVIIPGFMTNITRVKSLLEQVHNGVQSRELSMHKMAAYLSEIVEKAQKTENQFDEFKKKNKDKLNAKQKEQMDKAENAIKAASTDLKKVLTEVTQDFGTVTNLKKNYSDMRKGVEKIASGKPTWAEVGEVLITTTASVGFMVAGNVNSPDAFKGMENLNNLATLIGNAQGSIDAGMGFAQSVENSAQ